MPCLLHLHLFASAPVVLPACCFTTLLRSSTTAGGLAQCLRRWKGTQAVPTPPCTGPFALCRPLALTSPHHAAAAHPPQLLHWAWRDNQRLWLLATPAASATALEIGSLVDAVVAYRAQQAQQGAPGEGAWLPRHYEAAALAIAAVDTAALAAATVCLLAAAVVAAAGAGSGEGGREPLLGEQRARKRRGGPWEGSRRIRLVQGTLRYLVPDTLPLKLRWVGRGAAREAVLCFVEG